MDSLLLYTSDFLEAWLHDAKRAELFELVRPGERVHKCFVGPASQHARVQSHSCLLCNFPASVAASRT